MADDNTLWATEDGAKTRDALLAEISEIEKRLAIDPAARARLTEDPDQWVQHDRDVYWDAEHRYSAAMDAWLEQRRYDLTALNGVEYAPHPFRPVYERAVPDTDPDLPILRDTPLAALGRRLRCFDSNGREHGKAVREFDLF